MAAVIRKEMHSFLLFPIRPSGAREAFEIGSRGAAVMSTRRTTQAGKTTHFALSDCVCAYYSPLLLLLSTRAPVRQRFFLCTAGHVCRASRCMQDADYRYSPPPLATVDSGPKDAICRERPEAPGRAFALALRLAAAAAKGLIGRPRTRRCYKLVARAAPERRVLILTRSVQRHGVNTSLPC